MIMIVIQLVIKINIDNKYNEDKFGEIFEQIKTDDDENKKYSIKSLQSFCSQNAF